MHLIARVSQLDQKASDWSNWDDTYAFVKDHNKKYVDSNLQNESLANLGIDYMLFFNSSNQLVEMKHIQLDSSDLPSLPLDQGMKDLFRADFTTLATLNYHRCTQRSS